MSRRIGAASCQSNVTSAVMRRLTRWGLIRPKRERAIARNVIDRLRVKLDTPEQSINTLSGGNQQKVVFGKWVVNDPKIFILNEPTRGVDVGAKFEIYSIIADLAKRGSTILIVSAEIEELFGTCDRILVMRDGSISANVAKDDFDQDKMLEYAIPN